MIYAQNVGTVPMVLPQSVATNETARGIVDCKGADYLSVVFTLDTQAATSSNPAVLKLLESDDTVVTNAVDITAFVGDGSGGFTIPDAVTATGQCVRLNVDLRGRKRYIRCEVTPAGAAQLVNVTGSLSRANDSTEIRAKNAAVVDG